MSIKKDDYSRYDYYDYSYDYGYDYGYDYRDPNPDIPNPELDNDLVLEFMNELGVLDLCKPEDFVFIWTNIMTTIYM